MFSVEVNQELSGCVYSSDVVGLCEGCDWERTPTSSLRKGVFSQSSLRSHAHVGKPLPSLTWTLLCSCLTSLHSVYMWLISTHLNPTCKSWRPFSFMDFLLLWLKGKFCFQPGTELRSDCFPTCHSQLSLHRKLIILKRTFQAEENSP